MSNRLNGAGLFSQAISGLTQGYSYLLQQSESKNGVSIDDIYKSYSNTTSSSLLNTFANSSFASYLSSNFGSFDSNSDGVISTEEMSNMTNTMYAQGLTREQLVQLASRQAYTSENLEEVLNNFDKIDKNHDGRVSNAEINAFGIDEEISEKQQGFDEKRLQRMSLFNNSSLEKDEEA